MKGAFFFIAALAIVITVIFKPFTPITAGETYPIGNVKYDITPLTAPAASGFLLEILSYIISRSRFGPSISRKLLNDNRIEEIRELAAQIDLPPMYFPMRRYNAEEWKEYVNAIEPNTIEKAIEEGVSPKPLILHSEHTLKTIEDYSVYYSEGKGKPSDVIKKTLQTIREWENQGFRIFSSIREEAVLKQAYEADKRLVEGKRLSILDGVPVAFKDSLEIIDHISYSGQNPRPEFDAFVKHGKRDDILIRRFREAGAIILGLTIMIEGGVTPVGYSAHFQGPFSPYSWNRYSGGSSSGSAVAVATGLVPVAVGFDGGGSVRLPAMMSGIHGLATGFARCPFEMELDSTLIKSGPIAASSADIAIAYSVMCRTDPNHFYARLYDGGVHGPPPLHITGYNKIDNLSDVRLGIFIDYFNDSDIHIRHRVYSALQYLQEKHHVTLVPIQIPHLRASHLAHGCKIATEFAVNFDKTFHAKPSGLEPNTDITIAIGSSASALEELAGEKLRHYMFDYFTKLMKRERLDGIVTPTIGVDVPILPEEGKRIGESDTARALVMTRHIFLANFLGLPGYSVPVGVIAPKTLYPTEPKDLKLPVGLQIFGDHWQEHKLIRIAHAVEVGFLQTLPEEDRVAPRLFSYHPF